MADDKQNEGVYGENLPSGEGTSASGIREETVGAHPQPTGDAAVDPEGADAASEVRTRGAEAIERSEGSVEEDLDAVRRGAAQEAGSGGMGREGTPRNEDGTTEGVYGENEPDLSTPG